MLVPIIRHQPRAHLMDRLQLLQALIMAGEPRKIKHIGDPSQTKPLAPARIMVPRRRMRAHMASVMTQAQTFKWKGATTLSVPSWPVPKPGVTLRMDLAIAEAVSSTLWTMSQIYMTNNPSGQEQMPRLCPKPRHLNQTMRKSVSGTVLTCQEKLIEGERRSEIASVPRDAGLQAREARDTRRNLVSLQT
jgi:hypothetical protein